MGGRFFGRWGRIALYSLGIVVVLVVAGWILFGARTLLGPDEEARQNAPVVSSQEKGTTSGKKESTTKEMTQAQAPSKAGEKPETEAREEAARKAADEAAEEKATAERTAREAELQAQLAAQLQAEQAAAEQAAAEQAAAEQAAAEQASVAQNTDPAGLFPQALAAPSSTTFYLTVPRLGLSGVPVVDDTSEAGLSQGAGHLPGTGFPWIAGSNTYVAGHRLGYAGTASDHVFYGLPSLVAGDEVIVSDSSGQSYTYVVSEILEVTPYDLSVTAPVPGRDVLTLQTCIENFGDYWTPGPNWFARYVVRADRVA